jgi:hypothetical protein
VSFFREVDLWAGLNPCLDLVVFDSPEGEHQQGADVWMFDNEIDWVIYYKAEQGFVLRMQVGP